MLKENIFRVIKLSRTSLFDREKWLASEVAELGLRHGGLDDISIESIFVLAALFARGVLDDGELLEIVEITPSKLEDCLVVLRAYALVGDCSDSGNHKLTEKGEAACHEIFSKFIVRTRFELKRELEIVERIHSELYALK